MEDNTTHNKPESKSSAPKGKLAGALMRTFRGDITKELGDKAPEIVEKLVPAASASNIAKGTKQDETLKPEMNIPEPEEGRKAKPDSLLHTYKGDVQQLVKRKKISLMRMAADEADRKDGTVYGLAGRKNPIHIDALLLMVLAFILLGIVALGGAYYVYILREQTIIYKPQHNSLIFTESVETVDITGKNARALRQELARVRKGAYYSFGSIAELLLVRQHENIETNALEFTPLSAQEFLEAFDTALPEKFMHIFGDKFMLGLHATEENTPFLVLQTNLYDYAFDGMLTWEGRIEQDLAPLFSPNGEYTEPAMFKGSSAFTDTVMNNLDVRVLRDAEGKIRLLYSFVNKNTLVITTSVHTFVELAGRLRVSQ